MKDLLDDLLKRLRAKDAPCVEYADARWVEDRREQLRVRNREVTASSRARSSGVGIRVLSRGAWGFSATSDLRPAAIEAAAARAVEVAHASALVPRSPVRLAREEPMVASYVSPRGKDPFEVPLDDKIQVLVRACDRLLDGLGPSGTAQARMDWALVRKVFVSTEGARIEQDTLHGGAGISCLAVGDDGEAQRRSYPTHQDGGVEQGGWEIVGALDLEGNAERVREEAIELCTAPPCPSGERDLILEGSQLALQVHESCGHATELDRILGTEKSLAGGSFLRPEMLGSFRYGSPIIDIVADATAPGGLGTFAYDDEGVAARPVPLVDRGILVGFLSSRETAAEIGIDRSGGAMRADGALRAPLIRMVNVNLKPGNAGTLEDLVRDTRDGILMATNRSWSIDDLRLNFQFGCEAAWEIKDGRRTRLVKNPIYAGVTPRFWQSCDAITGPAEWRIWGLQTCGKGEPMQLMHVGHGASPARFRSVSVGSSRP
ncbi:MAG: TldD/PmbA family protein [Deltaproteobacteria bacterium]|nr:TldD/PmbA family protein [Deltaproteobacteria bacterium]